MQTRHYIVNNINEFYKDTEVVGIFKKYLDYIEGIFPYIEEVFGQKWNDDKINIILDDSKGGASYCSNTHIVKMGINNENVGHDYPKNLWGGLFHETHHAFLNSIIRFKKDEKDFKRNGKIFNGGHKAEVFNSAFMAMTYLKLMEKKNDLQEFCKKSLKDLEDGLSKNNEKYRTKGNKKYWQGEESLPDDAVKIFREYIELFGKNNNFPEFISYVKSSNLVFTELTNFRHDLDVFKKKDNRN